MYATLDETNRVVGYHSDEQEASIELSEEEYMRQISSNGYFFHMGNNVFEERAIEPPAPTIEEQFETKIAQRYLEEQNAFREVARMQVVAMLPTLTAAQIFKIRYIFPQWVMLIESNLSKAETPYIMHNDDFYAVNRDHAVQESLVPGVEKTGLYEKITE